MTPVHGAGDDRRKPPLTIGFVVDSLYGPAWLADAITAISEVEDAVVIGFVVGPGVGTPRAARVGRALLHMYGWLDGHLFGRSDDPTRIVDLEHALAGAVTLDRDVSRDEKPDLLIRFDGDLGPIGRWPFPRLGVWSVDHGMGLPSTVRPERFDLLPSGPEMFLGRSFTISQLAARVGGERIVVGQVVSRVDPLSLRRGARGHVRKLPSLLARTVSATRSDGVLPDPIVESAANQTRKGGETLGSAKIARGLATILVGYVRRLIRRRTAPERWVVAISYERDDPRGDDGRPFRFLEAPEGREWADPFPLRTSNMDLLFIEEYVRAAHKGRLAIVELDDSQRGWRSVETILEMPTHLSYPFVFEWSGGWYLLPEQANTGALQLYVAEAFPVSWRWHSTALALPVADATIAEIDGRWWMFAAMSVSGGLAADELHLFHAETPLGPWVAHDGNPVVSDVRTARSAGRIQRRADGWYRVAQDGAATYGHSIAIIRIDRIDLLGYAETVVDVIRPDWAPDLMATHTINGHDGLTALDGLRTEPRLSR